MSPDEPRKGLKHRIGTRLELVAIVVMGLLIFTVFTFTLATLSMTDDSRLDRTLGRSAAACAVIGGGAGLLWAAKHRA